MANKTFNTRVKNKRDTAANWEAVATTFQPLDGELIIVDTAAGKTRFKVGRYDTAKGRLLYYNEIPFADEYLYNDLNEAQGKIYDEIKNTVSYNAQTDITDAQKTQARTNIGAISSSEVSSNYLSLDDTQVLTEIQQDVLKNKLGYINKLKVLSNWVEATEQCKKEVGCVLVIQYNTHNDSDTIPENIGYPLLLIPNRVSDTTQSFHLIDAYGDNYACSFLYQSFKFTVSKLDMNQQTMEADPTEDMQIATKKYVDSAAVQADWNQNDETAKDYVKNRICYTEESITELGNTYKIWKELIGSTTEIINVPLSIKYDGIIYKDIKPQYIDQHYHYVLDSSGNSRIIVLYTGTGVDNATITAYPEKEWSFVQVNDPIIHQIPSEYINMDNIVNDGVIPFINGSFAPGIVKNFVAYGIEQSLSDDQKKQACDNIGARNLMCTITGAGTDASPYVCDKTYDEIVTAIKNGQIPYCIESGAAIYGNKTVAYYYKAIVETPVSKYVSFTTKYQIIGDTSIEITSANKVNFVTQNANVVTSINDKQGMVTLKTSDLENDSNYISTVDDALSTDSTNPVQNKVVKAAIDDLQANIDSKSMDKITNGDVTLACGGEDGTEYLTLTSTTDGSESQFYGNKWYLLFDSDHSTPSIQFYAPNSNKICGGISGSYGKLEGTTDILHDINFYTTTGSTYLTAKNNIILTTTTTDNYAGGDIEVKTQSPIGKFKIQMPTTVPAPTEDMSPATKKYVDDQITTVNNQLGGLTGAMHFIGKAAVDITDGSTTDPQIANYTTKEKGDVILGKDDHKEFVWNGTIWEELGDEGSYALKTTTINGKALSDNITLTASDVGAASASAIETMQAAIDSKPSAADAVYTATAASTDGVAYTATVSGIDSLTVGASFIMIPNKASTSKAPTLNVNGLGAKPIRRRLSSLTTSLQQGYSTNWIALNKPFTVVYDGTAWVIEGLTKTDGADVYGAVAQATADAKGNNIADTYATIAMLQSLLPKVTTITLTSNWVGDASPYYQDIALSCVTETSIVDLQPTPEQLNSWQDDGLAFTTLSGNGTVRVYVAGGKPSSAISVQVRVQEVTVI